MFEEVTLDLAFKSSLASYSFLSNLMWQGNLLIGNVIVVCQCKDRTYFLFDQSLRDYPRRNAHRIEEINWWINIVDTGGKGCKLIRI